MKEIQRFCNLGVLEWQPSSEWTAPSFIQPKKNKTDCMLFNRFLRSKQKVSKETFSDPQNKHSIARTRRVHICNSPWSWKPKHFPYLTRQVPCSRHTSNGVFQTKGRGKLLMRFFKYSNSKEFPTEPDVFEFDRKMGKPVFNLIIGCNSMEK